MAVLGTRGNATTVQAAAAAAASCHHPHADGGFDTMAYLHSCNGGSASTYYDGASYSPAGFGTGAAGPAPQLDVFEYLSDEGVPSVVPPAAPFGTPPRMEAEHVVLGGSGYGHSRCRPVPGQYTSAATAAGEGERRTDRIAFRTRSEEEVLDDGYKWRKYGKKSVKNSPSPRNYYRCSTDGCNVKKRVERDRDDPSYVVTMYEGVHNHACPGTVYHATQDAASGRFFVAGMHHPAF